MVFFRGSLVEWFDGLEGDFMSVKRTNTAKFDDPKKRKLLNVIDLVKL